MWLGSIYIPFGKPNFGTLWTQKTATEPQRFCEDNFRLGDVRQRQAARSHWKAGAVPKIMGEIGEIFPDHQQHVHRIG